jgi:hypothetical protein
MEQTIKFIVLWVTVYQTTQHHIPEDGNLDVEFTLKSQ